jgi:hypothetical protein
MDITSEDQRWADKQLEAVCEAEDWMMEDGWIVAHPDDPRMREFLIESEHQDPEWADLVLVNMRSLAARRDAEQPGWDLVSAPSLARMVRNDGEEVFDALSSALQAHELFLDRVVDTDGECFRVSIEFEVLSEVIDWMEEVLG